MPLQCECCMLAANDWAKFLGLRSVAYHIPKKKKKKKNLERISSKASVYKKVTHDAYE